LTQQHKIGHEILETLGYLSYGENPKSLSRLVSKQYQVVTDRQTDTKTELP